MNRLKELGRREAGAEAVEFAIVGPLAFFLVFGLIYLLLMFAAQLSLGYATNVGVRYAAVPLTASGGTYPSAAEVEAEATGSTPFFNPDSCESVLVQGEVNRPVSLTMNCDFPNPAGAVANAMRQAMFGGDEISSTLEMSATAQSRKE